MLLDVCVCRCVFIHFLYTIIFFNYIFGQISPPSGTLWTSQRCFLMCVIIYFFFLITTLIKFSPFRHIVDQSKMLLDVCYYIFYFFFYYIFGQIFPPSGTLWPVKDASGCFFFKYHFIIVFMHFFFLLIFLFKFSPLQAHCGPVKMLLDVCIGVCYNIFY